MTTSRSRAPLVRDPGRPFVLGWSAPPAPDRASRAALDGPSGDRLAALAGLARRQDLLSVADCRNVLPNLERSWRPPRAWLTARGEELRLDLAGRVGVVLGRAAEDCLLGEVRRAGARAGAREPVPFFDWLVVSVSDSQPLVVAVLPHPSGRCRTYNDMLARERARACLSTILGIRGRQLLASIADLGTGRRTPARPEIRLAVADLARLV